MTGFLVLGDYHTCARDNYGLDLRGFVVRVLDISALTEAKCAIGRPRHLLPAEELERINNRKQS